MAQRNNELKKEIGVWGLSANIINIMIGAGIFMLPAIIAEKMGPSSIISYLFCGVLIVLVVLCFAEAGSKVNNSGGPYTYIETAFGDYAGFIAGILAIGANALGSAAVSNALVEVLATINPVFKLEWMRLMFLAVIYLSLAMTNIFGVKQGIGLVKLNTILKLSPLLLLVIIGWKDVDLANLQIESLPTLNQLGETSLILFFAFLGCEIGLIVGDEIRNPKRTIPKAVFIAIGSVVLLYILIQTVSQGVLGAHLVDYKAAPLAEVAKIVLGPLGYIILILGAGISMFGFLSGDMLNTPRVLFALSRDNAIPVKKLSSIHKRYATPHMAIAVHCIIVFVIAATGSFEQLAVIATSAVLLLYFGVALSVLKLRKKQKAEAEDFVVPGGWTVPIISMGIILYFLSSLSSKEILWTLAFLAMLSLTYALLKLYKKKQP